MSGRAARNSGRRDRTCRVLAQRAALAGPAAAPGARWRLTWRHVTRWVLGLFLTVVLLGFVFAALRMAPRCIASPGMRTCDNRAWWPPYAPVSVPQPAPTPPGSSLTLMAACAASERTRPYSTAAAISSRVRSGLRLLYALEGVARAQHAKYCSPQVFRRLTGSRGQIVWSPELIEEPVNHVGTPQCACGGLERSGPGGLDYADPADDRRGPVWCAEPG